MGARDKVFEAATRSNPDLKCYFCTTGSGEISDAITALIQSNFSRLSALNIFGSIDISCLGARDIQQAFRSATNSSTASIVFPKNITLPEHENIDEAYIGYVTADQVLELALGDPDGLGERHINRALFYDNVRDFNPSSEINNPHYPLDARMIVVAYNGYDKEPFRLTRFQRSRVLPTLPQR